MADSKEFAIYICEMTWSPTTIHGIEGLAALTRTRILEGKFYEDPSCLPICPSLAVLQEIFNILFYASLRTEEGQPIQVRVYYSDPAHPDPAPPPTIRADRWQMFALGDEIPLTTTSLTKFAKAADAWSTGIAIYHTEEKGVFIWGLVDQVLHLSTSLVRENEGTYLQAGLFHAVINGPADITVLKETTLLCRLAQDRLISEQNDCFSSGPLSDIVDSHLSAIGDEVFGGEIAVDMLNEDREMWNYELKRTWIRTVSRIVLQIQRQRHGGALLLCNEWSAGSLRLKHKLSYPRLADGLKDQLFYRVLQAKSQEAFLSSLKSKGASIPKKVPLDLLISEKEFEDVEQMMSGAVRFVSSLAGIDGLVLLGTDLSVAGFGGIISIEDPISEVQLCPTPQGFGAITGIERFGTRHGSMIRFCNQHPGAIGVVVSQDGDVRVITKLSDECLLFDNVRLQDIDPHTATVNLQAAGEPTEARRKRERPVSH